jgi:hypothetical protein
MRNRFTLPLALALLMLASGAALAQESSHALPSETAKRNLVQGSLGLGSPVGAMGISYTYAPIPEAGVELGGGLGFSGYQLALMPKLSLGNGRDRFVVGVGPSLSIDRWQAPQKTYVGYWLNGEVGYQHQTASGLSVLVAAGFTYGLGGEIRGHEASAYGDSARAWDQPIAGRLLPQGRIAVGRWF